jgi:hypothetical protein
MGAEHGKQWLATMSAQIPIFPNLPYGFPFKKSPTFQGISNVTPSGRSVRAAQRNFPQYEYELTFEGLRDQTLNAQPYAPLAGYVEFQQLLGAFLALGGRFGMFLFSDPSDNSRANGFLGTGDGATVMFDVFRTIGQGATAAEPIGALDLTGAFNVYFDGVFQGSGYAIADGSDGSSATITFASPPGSGVTITIDFSFYYLCFFSEDQLDFEEFFKNYYALKSLKFRTVLPPAQVAFPRPSCPTFPPSNPNNPPPNPHQPPPPPPNPCGTTSVSAGGTWDSGAASTDGMPHPTAIHLSPTAVTLVDNAAAGTFITSAVVTMSDGSTFTGTLSTSNTDFFAISGMDIVTARDLTSGDDNTTFETTITASGMGFLPFSISIRIST